MLDFIEMRKQLQKALASSKLFVRISWMDEEETIQHYYLTHNFPREDIMISIEHIAKEILPETLETEQDEEDNT
jgi:hypothetical protein